MTRTTTEVNNYPDPVEPKSSRESRKKLQSGLMFLAGFLLVGSIKFGPEVLNSGGSSENYDTSPGGAHTITPSEDHFSQPLYEGPIAPLDGEIGDPIIIPFEEDDILPIEPSLTPSPNSKAA